MLRITDWSPEPVHEVAYDYAEPGGGVGVGRLIVTRAAVVGLPAGLDALVLTADLQGTSGGRLPGEVLAEELATLGELGELSDPARTGVVLAGDLFADPSAGRGGSGDIRAVWRAFAGRFRWAAGVAGNHDQSGVGPADLAAFAASPGVYYLDGDAVELDGLLIGGVGGIVGREGRPFRRSEPAFRAALGRVLAGGPDLVVLHGGPDAPEAGLIGSAAARECVLAAAPTLVVCGHCHWPEPMHTFATGAQVCNVDARAVLLVPSDR